MMIFYTNLVPIFVSIFGLISLTERATVNKRSDAHKILHVVFSRLHTYVDMHEDIETAKNRRFTITSPTNSFCTMLVSVYE